MSRNDEVSVAGCGLAGFGCGLVIYLGLIAAVVFVVVEVLKVTGVLHV